jgi:hypothetical protein
MIGDDESHLSVRQHGSLRAAGRARGEKEPAGIVVFDCGVRSNASLMFADYCLIIVAERRCADRDHKIDRRRRAGGASCMFGKFPAADHRSGAADAGEVSDFIRRQSKIRWHPNRSEPETHEHRLEELIAIPSQYEDAVSLAYAARRKRCSHGVDAGVEPRPRPPISPDTRPTASGYRFADCRKKCARFITRREHGAMPPFGTDALIRALSRDQLRNPVDIHGTAATMIVPITSASI